MSTATSIDYKIFLVQMVRTTAARLVKDLSYIPSEKLSEIPMGCARPPLEFTAECAGFNNLVAGALKGTAPAMPSPERRAAFFRSIDSYEKAKEAVESSAEALASSLAQAGDEVLTQEVVAPWGERMPLYQLVFFTVSHMNYHDGQINYLQCLYGDGTFHWMED